MLYLVWSGYTGLAEAAVSISQPSNVMLTAIPGSGGGVSQASATWDVSVTALLGYTLTISASSTPAMASGTNTIPDYATASPNTPEAWSIPASTSAFGFSAQGPDTSTNTWGTPATGQGKYRGFSGGSQIQIASAGLLSSGNPTTVYFKVEVGSSAFQPSGMYTATITATATTGL